MGTWTQILTPKKSILRTKVLASSANTAFSTVVNSAQALSEITLLQLAHTSLQCGLTLMGQGMFVFVPVLAILFVSIFVFVFDRHQQLYSYLYF